MAIRGPESGSQRYARAWGDAIAGTSYVSLVESEINEMLVGLAEQLRDALHQEPFDASRARQVGAALIQAHFTGPDTLGRSLEIMGTRMASDLVAGDLASDVVADRVAALQGMCAAGYVEAHWKRTLDEQDQLRKALLAANAQAQQALRDSEARFRAVFAGAGVGIGIADVEGNVLEMNPLMADMLKGSNVTLPGLGLMSIFDAEDMAMFMSLANGGRDHHRFEKRYLRPDGSGAMWLDLTVSLIRGDLGTPRYIVCMARDITQRQILQDRLQHEATHDPLTQLPNRTLFFERLGDLFAQAGAETRVGVCYLDIDGFKIVNDTLGHDTGDELLAVVAARLGTRVSAMGHFAARVGGDEFVLLVSPSSGLTQVTELADAVLETLREPVPVGVHRLQVTASVGIVECRVRSTTPAELMKAADVTVYWAKADGGAGWTVFEPERHARQIARYNLAAAMPSALERHEFFLEYQPLVRLVDGSLVGVEALVRWRHPKLGRLSPDSFIGIAEEAGLIVPLGAWALEEGCRQAHAWHADGVAPEGLFVSVNLAAQQAHAPGIADDVARILDRTGLNAAILQLELTESAVMGTADEPLLALERLSQLGVRIAIDDFGTGYSNLAYLRRLPVHGLKLAGPFLEGLRTDRSDAVDEQIVATLVNLAHALGLNVTAEGVETAEQADRLRDLGCDFAQGNHYARPLSAKRIAQVLEAKERLPS